jgi:hypothetical protein
MPASRFVDLVTSICGNCFIVIWSRSEKHFTVYGSGA